MKARLSWQKPCSENEFSSIKEAICQQESINCAALIQGGVLFIPQYQNQQSQRANEEQDRKRAQTKQPRKQQAQSQQRKDAARNARQQPRRIRRKAAPPVYATAGKAQRGNGKQNQRAENKSCRVHGAFSIHYCAHYEKQRRKFQTIAHKIELCGANSLDLLPHFLILCATHFVSLLSV